MPFSEVLELFRKEVKRIEFFKKECQSCVSDEVLIMYKRVLEILELLKDIPDRSFLINEWIPKNVIRDLLEGEY